MSLGLARCANCGLPVFMKISYSQKEAGKQIYFCGSLCQKGYSKKSGKQRPH
jgi:hypothetical protein